MNVNCKAARMSNEICNCLGTTFKVACALLFLVAGIGCSYDPLTITGKVVDESGAALGDVTVWACYSGWGWNNGYLVWDQDYCSETVQTNQDGRYVIKFKGPASLRLRARKDGWVQAQDFNTTHSRIILTKNADYSARLRSEAQLREKRRRQRIPAESDTEYYCRVILPEVRPVNLNYQKEILLITPNLLSIKDNRDAFFALRGSSSAVNAFTSEMVLRVNGETRNNSILLNAVGAGCEDGIHFVGVNLPSIDSWTNTRVEILVPSISAMFDIQIWRHQDRS